MFERYQIINLDDLYSTMMGSFIFDFGFNRFSKCLQWKYVTFGIFASSGIVD